MPLSKAKVNVVLGELNAEADIFPKIVPVLEPIILTLRPTWCVDVIFAPTVTVVVLALVNVVVPSASPSKNHSLSFQTDLAF